MRGTTRHSRRPPALRIIWGLVAVLAIATAAAMVALWPAAGDRPELAAGLTGDTLPAEVERVAVFACVPASLGTCAELEARVLDGPETGRAVTIDLGGGGSLVGEVDVGTRIRVLRSEPPPAAADGPGAETGAADARYTFVDFERRSTLIWLALLYAALVIVFARLRGLLSLVGLALSLGIVLVFIVPAILAGTSPFTVAIVGSLAVMLVTIPLVHGIRAKSMAAILGTTFSLLLTAGLALAFTQLAKLTGLGYDEAVILEAAGVQLSFQGLLLAGMVIGALGVIDDVTVSQSSTVFALRAANPAQRFGELYRGALEVGRDHVAAVVNTLVLAYVGAALPVLLVFGSSGVAFGTVVNLEVVSREIVAMLVGSIGLIAAVPLTTAIAAWLARALPVETVAAEAEEGHSH